MSAKIRRMPKAKSFNLVNPVILSKKTSCRDAMSFDPSQPADHSALASQVMREQLNGSP
jgi:hypothetical protein